jgi:hypothetical protein
MATLTIVVLLVGAAWLAEARARQRGERALIPVPVDRETPRRRS